MARWMASFETLLTHKRNSTKGLYCGADLLGSLRHAQLRLVGAPRKEKEVMDEVKMETGNLWHENLHLKLRGEPVMCEVRISDWLPEGWGGRLDWLFWDVEQRKFVLKDLKTTSSTYWVSKKGAKDSHIWQLSAYYHALKEAKFPLATTFSIIYFPLSGKYGPLEMEMEPIPKKTVWPRMKSLWKLTSDYLSEYEETGEILNKKLQEPMRNHWSNPYCPFLDSYCDCSKGETDAS